MGKNTTPALMGSTLGEAKETRAVVASFPCNQRKKINGDTSVTTDVHPPTIECESNKLGKSFSIKEKRSVSLSKLQ